MEYGEIVISSLLMYTRELNGIYRGFSHGVRSGKQKSQVISLSCREVGGGGGSGNFLVRVFNYIIEQNRSGIYAEHAKGFHKKIYQVRFLKLKTTINMKHFELKLMHMTFSFHESYFVSDS